MPSKKSKTSASPFHPWKAARDFSEGELALFAGGAVAGEVQPGDRLLLEGPLGAGKTTFARALLLGLGVEQPPEGSPTFAIAHEYSSRRKGGVAHIDLYRLKSEEELEDAGILDLFWSRGVIVIAEWTSLMPELRSALLADAARGKRTWNIELKPASGGGALLRDLDIATNF